MYYGSSNLADDVHCHVGSLESDTIVADSGLYVHCHVGSLEKIIISVF